MRKLILHSVKFGLQGRKLTEDQMKELCGGMKCPHCNYDFEPDDFEYSRYTCEGKLYGIPVTKYYWARSISEAGDKACAEGLTNVGCYPGEGYVHG